MGLSAVEARVQRKQTEAFIRADSLTVVLNRTVFASDGAGGHTRTVSALSPQQMRLIPLQDGTPAATTADGEMISPSYMLMGGWDADLERWDTFTLDGSRYEVVSVNENRQYETKGEVVYRGN